MTKKSILKYHVKNVIINRKVAVVLGKIKFRKLTTT